MSPEGSYRNSSSDAEPPRKRQRTEVLELHPGSRQFLQSTSDIPTDHHESSHDLAMCKSNDLPVRDETYYIDGADCVIKVENTLFKVHRFLLARDSSAFQDMFTLPSGDANACSQPEGFSDENPIHLYSESAEDFRVLLSVFYALPFELAAYNSASADVSRLLTIASVANKYHFVTTSTWAISAVHAITSCDYGVPTDTLADLAHASSASLTRVLEVALRCGHTALVDDVVECWCSRISNHKIGPRAAMHVADAYNVRSLRGTAYYVQLVHGGIDLPADIDAHTSSTSVQGTVAPTTIPASTSVASAEAEDQEEDDSSLPLTPAQQIRLLTGFWSLSQLWERLSRSPPTLPHPEDCTYHIHGCVSTFTSIWSEALRSERTLQFGPADVMGRLEAVEFQLRTNKDLSHALSPNCKYAAIFAVRKLIKEVDEGLADRFTDVPGAV